MPYRSMKPRQEMHKKLVDQLRAAALAEPELDHELVQKDVAAIFEVCAEAAGRREWRAAVRINRIIPPNHVRAVGAILRSHGLRWRVTQLNWVMSWERSWWERLVRWWKTRHDRWLTQAQLKEMADRKHFDEGTGPYAPKTDIGGDDGYH